MLKNYTLKYKFSILNIAIHNLSFELNQLSEAHDIDSEYYKKLVRCREALDRTKSANLEFGHLIEDLID